MTLALDTGRLYRFLFTCPFTIASTTERAIFELFINGVLARSVAVEASGVASQGLQALMAGYFVPSTNAAVAHKIMARTTNAAAAVGTPFPSATNPIEFVIEDVGVAQ